MKSYNIKNKAKRLIVCTLKDGSTLRLLDGDTSVITESNLTNNFKNLEKRGLVLITPITKKPKKVAKEPTTKKEEKKED